jgi:hypothetical protein
LLLLPNSPYEGCASLDKKPHYSKHLLDSNAVFACIHTLRSIVSQAKQNMRDKIMVQTRVGSLCEAQERLLAQQLRTHGSLSQQQNQQAHRTRNGCTTPAHPQPQAKNKKSLPKTHHRPSAAATAALSLHACSRHLKTQEHKKVLATYLEARALRS